MSWRRPLDTSDELRAPPDLHTTCCKLDMLLDGLVYMPRHARQLLGAEMHVTTETMVQAGSYSMSSWAWPR